MLNSAPTNYQIHLNFHKIQAAKLKQKISPKTGLPSTPNSIKIYGKIEGLFSIQKELYFDPFLSQIFPKILAVYRAHNNCIVVITDREEICFDDSGSEIGSQNLQKEKSQPQNPDLKNLTPQQKLKILKFYQILHSKNITLGNSNFNFWFQNFVTHFGLYSKGKIDLHQNLAADGHVNAAPEAKFYQNLKFVPHVEALKSLDVLYVCKSLGLDSNFPEINLQNPLERPSISEFLAKFVAANLGILRTNETLLDRKYRHPITQIDRQKLFQIWLKKEGGLSKLLLDLNFMDKKPGLISIFETIESDISSPENSPSNSPRHHKKPLLKPQKSSSHLKNFGQITCNFPLTENATPLLMDWNLPKIESLEEGMGINGNVNSNTLHINRDDFEHNFSQISLFSYITNAYPITKPRLLKELEKKAIPDTNRKEIWKCLLEIERSEKIDVNLEDLSETMSRQLDVDIPRCHQYNNTLYSPNGQQLLKRVLSKWILVNEGKLTYWQGLDSLCAPFVILYIDDEDLVVGLGRKFLSAKFCLFWEFFWAAQTYPQKGYAAYKNSKTRQQSP